MALITCPYCLTQREFRSARCENPECGRDLPKQYFDGASKQEPIWLVSFGPPQVGKTRFISSMSLAAENLSKVARGAFMNYLDDDTRKAIAKMRVQDREGQANPGSTQWHDRPVPLLLMISNFPPKRSNVVVIYDLPGELVDVASSKPEYARAVQKAQTVWFMVSLDDLEQDPSGRSMVDLFIVYQQMMDALNVPIEGRTILVTYTKADRMLRHEDDLRLPDQVFDYLADDPYDQIKEKRGADLPAFDEDAYFADMQRIDQVLREYTADIVPGGGSFISMAEANGAQVFFTMNSALGGDPNPQGQAGHEIRRIRVLDALIWAMKLSGTRASALEATLILPATENNQVYGSNLPLQFFEALKRNGASVTSYYMGEMEPAFNAGAAPVNPHPASRVPLIGPILDKLSTQRPTIVLLDDAVPYDLNDFVDTSWNDYLLVVTQRRHDLGTWMQNKVQYKPDSDLDQLVRDFFKRIPKTKGSTS